ncbi:Anti-sigma regulatory factor (Ser/Thr protein kinase) [Amycolatopsis arida]|uniref:Anti-sigma regulatory factor (Ser/Thr protein kinase) n=1 Tax=Amycolatopsis arida TaxID=587909 RepID=A0A1I5M276_9PSEU|nr:sensor histidine kinase [Amycolatopsis arida]TDX93932.1 anti-sigma regulatory factor (Ser/Thr protein kinase) [Amycolatopsis arida]SFP03447.1 Anti-sigma regulatory factor (Ser/Thr protein kinase) [Amycolatopsis arida]
MSTGFVHNVLVVDSDQALRERLLPALRRSLAAGESVLMVVGPHTERIVRDALGTDAARLEWGDPSAIYQRLGFAFATFRRRLAEEHARGRVLHVVAEPDVRTDLAPDAPVDRAAAYLSYEAICNEAFARYGCPVTCLWDSRSHPTLVIEGARALHPHELGPSGPFPNPDFVPPESYLAGRNQVALEPPPTSVDLDLALYDVPELAGLRARAREWARGHGFDRAAAEDVVIATGEVATNGLLHGAPPARVRCWRRSDTLVVQVDDARGVPLPPTAGYQPPDDTQPGGRGMWIARQLADVVTTHTVPGTVTTVRMYFPHARTHHELPLTDGRGH